MSMEMRAFQDLNAKRCQRWHPIEGWDISEWLVALGGELGEAMNVAKKLNRIRDGMKTRPEEADAYILKGRLVAELADVYIYLDLIFSYLEVSKERAVAQKFNATSVEWGFPEGMPVPEEDVRY